MAFDAAGNLYVANQSGNNAHDTVSEFAPGATSPTAILTGLNGPDALAFDGSGNLYVANSYGTTVSMFMPGAISPSAVLTGLSSPHAVAVDRTGNVYVANGNVVSRFAPGATSPSVTLTGLDFPQALAFDGYGNLFVANGNNGSSVSIFAPGATVASTTLVGLTNPAALVFDWHGNLYVTNMNGSTLSIFAPGATTASNTLTGLNNPLALAIDGDGNVYVSNYFINTVSRFALPAPVASGLVGNDTIRGVAETYSNANVGTGKVLSVSAYVVGDGNGGKNYAVTTVANVTGSILAAPLTITATSNTKNFDGTTMAAAIPMVAGLQGVDNVTGLSESYDNASPGLGKTQTVNPGFTVHDGNGGLNYVVGMVADATGVVIGTGVATTTTVNAAVAGSGVATVTYGTPLTISATVSANSGTMAPTLGSVDFKDTSENIDLGVIGTSTIVGTSAIYTLVTTATAFRVLTLNAGLHTISATYFPGTGFNASSASLSGGLIVDPAPLTIAPTANTKTYDKDLTAASIPTATALFGTDTVTGLVESYSSAVAGSGKTLSVYTGTSTVAWYTGLPFADALAVDPSGNLYVAELGASIVSKLRQAPRPRGPISC